MAIVWLAALGACASSSAGGTPPRTAGAPMHGGHHGHGGAGMAGPRDRGATHASCPMAVSDAHVRAEEIEGGVALSFTTEGGDAAELRRRVHALAQRQHPPADGMGRPCGPMPATTASVEETPNGARLLLKPRDPAQLDALRRHAQMHAARMEDGNCPMMACGADAQ